MSDAQIKQETEKKEMEQENERQRIEAEKHKEAEQQVYFNSHTKRYTLCILSWLKSFTNVSYGGSKQIS